MHTIEEARAHSRGAVSQTAGGWRPAMRPETGPERAQRRAWARGLEVGKPVRADIGISLRPAGPLAGMRATSSQHLVPLEFGERLSNYRIQQAVRTHSIGGTRWRPTPRQRRRLDKKARAAALSKYLEGRREEARLALEHGDAYYAAMSGEQAKPRGFTMIDRRGEHAAR